MKGDKNSVLQLLNYTICKWSTFTLSDLAISLSNNRQNI